MVSFREIDVHCCSGFLIASAYVLSTGDCVNIINEKLFLNRQNFAAFLDNRRYAILDTEKNDKFNAGGDIKYAGHNFGSVLVGLLNNL